MAGPPGAPDTIGSVPVFVVGFILGASVAAAASIIFPSKRVRQERPLDDETETRILLGLDPDEPAGAVPPTTVPHEFDTAQLAALRDLDAEETGPSGSA